MTTQELDFSGNGPVPEARPDVLGIEKIMQGQAPKYGCGRIIFCPSCETLMDCTRAVQFDIFRTVGGKEEMVSTTTICAICWDRKRTEIIGAIAKIAVSHPFLKPRIEVTDGRNIDWEMIGL